MNELAFDENFLNKAIIDMMEAGKEPNYIFMLHSCLSPLITAQIEALKRKLQEKAKRNYVIKSEIKILNKIHSKNEKDNSIVKGLMKDFHKIREDGESLKSFVPIRNKVLNMVYDMIHNIKNDIRHLYKELRDNKDWITEVYPEEMKTLKLQLKDAKNVSSS